MTLIHDRLVAHLAMREIDYAPFQHQETRTSAESHAARLAAGAPPSIGAKALLLKASKLSAFCVVVVPASSKFNAKAVKAVLGDTRFAKSEEFSALTEGLQPGSLPPFAAPVVPAIDKLFIDPKIFNVKTVAFNAADLACSFIMSAAEYEKAVQGLHALLPEAAV